MKLWDYKIPKGWKPTTEAGWLWYLERKINYDDWKGIDPRIVRQYYHKLHLDPGRRLMIDAYFRRYGSQ